MIEFETGGVRVAAEAVRADIVRLRVWLAGAAWPTRHSYAVVRRDRLAVEPIETATTFGFATAALSVRLERRTGAIEVRHAGGRVLFASPPDMPPERRPRGIALHHAIAPDDRFFGLGDKPGPLERRDQAFTFWNTDRVGFEESTDPIYKSIPVLFMPEAGASLMLLLDNTHRSAIDIGKQTRNILTIAVEAPFADLYILAGARPVDALGAYAWLTGPARMIPLWALGHQLSRYSYMDAAEVREVAAGLRAQRFPADALYLDIDYQDRFRTFTTDPERFPDLAGLVAELAAQGMRTVAITDAPLPAVTDGSYPPYSAGRDGGHFVRTADGETFMGKMWGGASAFPDFARADTRAWWGTLYKDFVAAGVAGFWDDMNEPTVFDGPAGTIPLDARHRSEEPGTAPRDTDHAEIHNVYGLLNAQATCDGLEKLAPQARPFVLTRAASPGAQRYATTWTGDNTATWNHLRLAIAQLLNLGLSGFPFAGADLGGFFGSPSADLLTRWYQIGAWTPLFRNHCFQGMARREPWLDGEPHTSRRRDAVEERYRLLPYFYTLAEEASRTGIPIMRPLFLDFPGTLAMRPWFNRDPQTQFMVGDALCVAPPPFAELTDRYTVVLPGEGWFDYWTGQRLPPPGKPGGPTLVTQPPDDARVPVFARAGRIVPRAPLVQSTACMPQGALELLVYTGQKLRGAVYTDAGDGFGPSHRLSVQGTLTDERLTLRLSQSGDYAPWWSAIDVVVHDVGEPRAIEGAVLLGFSDGVARLRVAADSVAITF